MPGARCGPVGINPVLLSSLNTPPTTLEAAVLMLPLATDIGAVEYVVLILIALLYALVERKVADDGAAAYPPPEILVYLAEDVVYICACM